MKEYHNAVLDAAGEEVDIVLKKSANIPQDTETSSSESDLANLPQELMNVGMEEADISRKGREVDEENAEWRRFSHRHLDTLQKQLHCSSPFV